MGTNDWGSRAIAALAVAGVWFVVAGPLLILVFILFFMDPEAVRIGAVLCAAVGVLPAWAYVLMRRRSSGGEVKRVSFVAKLAPLVVFTLASALFVYMGFAVIDSHRPQVDHGCAFVLERRPEPPEWRSWPTRQMRQDFHLSVGKSRSYREMQLVEASCPPGVPIDGALACDSKSLVVRSRAEPKATGNPSVPWEDELYVVSAIMENDGAEQFLAAVNRRWFTRDIPHERNAAPDDIVPFVALGALVAGGVLALLRLRLKSDSAPAPGRYLLASLGLAGVLQYTAVVLPLAGVRFESQVPEDDDLDRLSAHPEWCRNHEKLVRHTREEPM
jgi:hypothetical protein